MRGPSDAWPRTVLHMWQLIDEQGSQLAGVRVHDFLCCLYEPVADLRKVSLTHLFQVLNNSGNSFLLMSLADAGLSIKYYSQFNDCFWWYFRVPVVPLTPPAGTTPA